jgi:hypothetical protein
MRKPCLRCGRLVLPHSRATRDGVPYGQLMQGRGLCTRCYRNVEYHGQLLEYPRLTRSRDELLEDYEVLRRQGYNWRECATILRINYPTFERALLRARAAGDPRARRLNERELAWTTGT